MRPQAGGWSPGSKSSAGGRIRAWAEPPVEWSLRSPADRTCKLQGCGEEPGNTGGSQRRWLFHTPDRRSPPRPPRPLPRSGEPKSTPFPFSTCTPDTSSPSLSTCREQTSWSPSLNPSVLSPPHSPTSESRAPETSKGGGAQDCGEPGPGVGENLGMGGEPARIPEKIGPRETEAWIAKESNFRDTLPSSPPCRACSMQTWIMRP